jgi:hypothetical protein
MLIIFCQGVPRAQTYQAEMEQKEGWFDDEGWRVDDPTDDPANWWFPDDPTRRNRPLDVVIGGKESGAPKWSLEAWRSAARLWDSHGERYGLVIEPARLERYRKEAERRPGPEATEEAIRRWQQKSNAVFFYEQNRSVTNFPSFLATAHAEERPATVQARKTLWQAEQARRLANKFGPRGAIALYREGLEQWKKVLIADKEFHRPERSERTDEETYTYELAYLRLLVQDDEDVRKRAATLARDVSTTLNLLPFPASGASQIMSPRLTDVQEALKWFIAEKVISPFALPMSERDGVTDERRGGPWVRDAVKESVQQAQGVKRKPLTEQPKPTEPVTPPGG